MDLGFSAEEIAFRDEVRDFRRHESARLDPRQTRRGPSSRARTTSSTWTRILAQEGLVGPALAGRMGRHGLEPDQALDLQRRNPARPCARIARLRHQHGRPGDLHLRLARRRRSASCRASPISSDWWCQGFSEPGAGSDLAGLRTTAKREGGEWVINGQKTWTTLAQYADWIFVLARTDASVKKQEGISFFLVDMKTPGVTVRPIQTIDGGHEVNEVFFDNVRIPLENIVGEENKGWDYAKFLLSNERNGIARVGVSKARLAQHPRTRRAPVYGDKPKMDDPLFRMKLAAVEVELKALEMTQMRVIAGERNRREGQAQSRLLGAQDQGLGIAAGDDRIADGRRRPLCVALRARARGWRALERAAGRARLGLDHRADLFQHAQGFDLRRLERNSAHRSSPRRYWGSERWISISATNSGSSATTSPA